ncbi:MAG: TonB-dependent receptor [Sediminibacterium sp.]|nr:TonB-dependent receptor [Sediminibacterium sp.]
MKFCTTLILIFAVLLLSAQQPTSKDKMKFGIIMGNLIEQANNKAVPFARVDLYNTADSLLFSTITDKNGSFEFSHLSFGYYSLRAKAMGLTDSRIDSIYLRADRYDFNIGDVKLKAASNELKEIIVYYEKPLIENKDDKLTYNVGESALSAGSSTAELLKNIPLVNNDPTGKILLKGKEPKILIDDKPTDLTPQQLQDLLESLPGSSIEKIEVMTNPPPQYATETGGVINIVTKKGKIGWVGRINLSAGTRGEGNFSGNISYRNKKLSFNQTIGAGASKLRGYSYSTRENKYTDSTNFFKTNGNFNNQNLRPNWRTQIDYEFNKNNSAGVVYQGNLNYYNNASANTYTNINRFNQVYKISTRENTSIGDGYNHGITLSYTHKGKNIAEVLRLIVTGNLNKNDNDRDFFQQFLNPDFNSTGIDSTQTQYFNNYSNSVSARIEYTKPLLKKGNSFSGGVNYLGSNYHNLLNTSFLRKSDVIMVPNDMLSNDFKFHQNIYTARVGVSLLITPSIRLTSGAQLEYTQMKFDFVKANVGNVSNQYYNLLPNATIRKEFNKTLSTSWIYRATIRRPGIGELNPNIDYSDPYNLRFGNPFLLPSLSHNFDWNVNWIKGKYYINTSIGYNKVENVFNSIRNLIEGGKTEITWLNIADRQEYELSAFGGYTFSKQFRMNGSMGYTFNQYSEREKQLYLYINGGSFYTNINYTYTPTNVWNFEGSARYNSFADPQGRSRSNISMNLGVQRKFFDRRLIVSMNMIDPFTPQQYVTVTNGQRFSIESVNATSTRNYRFSISYQLNKLVQKSSISDKEKKQLLDKFSKQ